ncbi:MAG TPA: FtsQ-type POTRA domain-containing protein [bacterium]|nr:FtsQ-type POTRA domain-containing protein [bacterium]
MIKKSYRKPYRIKKKKSIIRNRFFWFGLLILIIIISFFYFLFFSNTFQTKEVIITGEREISKHDIYESIQEKLENKISFLKTKSIFLINTNELEKDILNNFPKIDKVKIKKRFPESLNITIVERTSSASWCKEEICFLLDNKGIIFEQAQDSSDLIKIIDMRNNREFSLSDKVIEPNLLSQIIEINSKLKKDIKIAKVYIQPNKELNIKTIDDWEIYLNLNEDIDWQLTKLNLVLEKQIPFEKRDELDYIDLRFTKVYFKYK